MKTISKNIGWSEKRGYIAAIHTPDPLFLVLVFSDRMGV
jgi:hypothetical protein